jgi:hypothetical protein
LCITANLSADVADESFASIPSRPPYVRFALDSDHSADMPGRQLRANSGREQMQQMQVHHADLLDYFAGTGE